MIDALLQQAEGRRIGACREFRIRRRHPAGDATPVAEAAAREPSADTPNEAAAAPPPEAGAKEGAVPSGAHLRRLRPLQRQPSPRMCLGSRSARRAQARWVARRAALIARRGLPLRPALFSPSPASPPGWRLVHRSAAGCAPSGDR